MPNRIQSRDFRDADRNRLKLVTVRGLPEVGSRGGAFPGLTMIGIDRWWRVLLEGQDGRNEKLAEMKKNG